MKVCDLLSLLFIWLKDVSCTDTFVLEAIFSFGGHSYFLNTTENIVLFS